MKRPESQKQTRDQLLLAARDLFRAQGYTATSIDRIAARAGFSKGAFYSNFDSKEAVLLEVLDMARPVFDRLLAAILDAPADRIVDLLVDWADDRSRNGNWILAILEHARAARSGASHPLRLEAVLRDNWRQLGEALLLRFPGIAPSAETLGAMLHEIAYAPAMTIVSKPTAGELMRLAASPLLTAKIGPQSRMPRIANDAPHADTERLTAR